MLRRAPAPAVPTERAGEEARERETGEAADEEAGEAGRLRGRSASRGEPGRLPLPLPLPAAAASPWSWRCTPEQRSPRLQREELLPSACDVGECECARPPVGAGRVGSCGEAIGRTGMSGLRPRAAWLPAPSAPTSSSSSSSSSAVSPTKD
jgi:hypothetical protein